ncbi:hypothetical protein CBOM_04356 [Ceraceosorus bombacis]|uniref:Uncharacterized protein n=1 Tax=Ceraceosorus bombacis TaxID=401625 RepID=A0A0N7LA50_9BASI|nr:hypothetical protein CBOM_04356 [Ceraceosorus bombacis]
MLQDDCVDDRIMLGISRYWFAIVMRNRWQYVHADCNEVLDMIAECRSFPWLTREVKTLTVGSDQYAPSNFSHKLWGSDQDGYIIEPDIRSVPSLAERVFMDLRRIMRIPFYSQGEDCYGHPSALDKSREEYKVLVEKLKERKGEACECDMCVRIDEPTWPFLEPDDFYDADAFTLGEGHAGIEVEDYDDLNGPFGDGLIPGIDSFEEYWNAVQTLISLLRPRHLIMIDRAAPLPERLVQHIAALGCLRILEIKYIYPQFCMPAYYKDMMEHVEELSISVEWSSDYLSLAEWDESTQGADTEELESYAIGRLREETTADGSVVLRIKSMGGHQARLIDDSPEQSLGRRLLVLIESSSALRRLELLDDAAYCVLLSTRLLPVFATLDAVETRATKPASFEYCAGRLSHFSKSKEAHLAYTRPLSSLRGAFLSLVKTEASRPLRESDVLEVADRTEFSILSSGLRKMATEIVQNFNKRENLGC